MLPPPTKESKQIISNILLVVCIHFVNAFSTNAYSTFQSKTHPTTMVLFRAKPMNLLELIRCKTWSMKKTQCITYWYEVDLL